MSQYPNKLIQIDEEGHWMSEGLRVADDEYACELFENLRVDDRGRFVTQMDGTPVGVEAFDQPLVAKIVERIDNQFYAIMAHGYRVPIRLEQMTVDDWDRFLFRNPHGVPIVLSRPAQATFFNLLDDYDDDSITVAGQRWPVVPWLNPFPQSEKTDFWTHIYQNETPGWELGHESVVLPSVWPQLKVSRSRILVLGCGTGQDAAFFARQGHIVTAVDISAEAIERARAQFKDIKDLNFIEADIFKLPASMNGQFDVIFEHTCYCAIPPARRTELVQLWHRLLSEGGHLLGVFFTRDKVKGPPWGGSEWEVRERMKKLFRFEYWMRWRQSIPKRQGYEFVVYARKV